MSDPWRYAGFEDEIQPVGGIPEEEQALFFWTLCIFLAVIAAGVVGWLL